MKQLAIVLFAALAACVMPATSPGGFEGSYASSTQTSGGVYINGQLLTGAQEAELAQLIGEPVPAGRYVLDADGMFGLEGRTERVNLAAHIQSRRGNGGQGGGDTMMTDGRGSTMVGYGDCVSMTTPSGTFMGSGC
jgi:hypothetical protein